MSETASQRSLTQARRPEYQEKHLMPFDASNPWKILKEDPELSKKLDWWNFRMFKDMTPKEKKIEFISRLVPCVRWLRKYDWRRNLKDDILAGITVSFLIVPQGLSYAQVAGLPPIYGLYTDLLPLFIYALYGSAMYLQVGAVAVISLLTNTTVSDILASDIAAYTALDSKLSGTKRTLDNAADYDSLKASVAARLSALNDKRIEVALLLAFFTGLFQLVIGLLRFGNVMNLMSRPVISGFQTAAAITIAMSQMKNIFGYKNFTNSTHLNDVIQTLINYRDEINLRATAWAWGFVGILVLFKQLGLVKTQRKWLASSIRTLKVCGTILVCIMAILISWLGEQSKTPYCPLGRGDVFPGDIPSAPGTSARPPPPLPPPSAPGALPPSKGMCVSLKATTRKPWPDYVRWRGMETTGKVPGGLPVGRNHDWSLVDGRLIAGAVVCAFVGALETIAIGKSLATRRRQRDHSCNQEWVALGLMNLLGSFTCAYVSAGSFSRSALNDASGAKSPVSVLVVAIVVLLFLLFLTPVVTYLPKTVLSAIVVVALMNLADPEEIKWLFKYDRKDLVLWLVAFFCVLFTGVEIGIVCAVGASFAVVLLESASISAVAMKRLAGTKLWVDARQYMDTETVPGVEVLRLDGPLYFANAAQVAERLESLAQQNAICCRKALEAAQEALREEALRAEGLRAEANGNGDRDGQGEEERMRPLGSNGESNGDLAGPLGLPPCTGPHGVGEPCRVVLDFGGCNYLDSTALHYLQEALQQMNHHGVLLAIANPPIRVLHKLDVTGLLGRINSQFGQHEHWVFAAVDDAARAAQRWRPLKREEIVKLERPELPVVPLVPGGVMPEPEGLEQPDTLPDRPTSVRLLMRGESDGDEESNARKRPSMDALMEELSNYPPPEYNI